MSIREDELIDDLQEEIANLQRQLEEKTRLLAAYEAHVDEWRVGRFYSSSQPSVVLCLAVGDKQIREYENHRSFIEWMRHREHLDALLAEAERKGMERAAEMARKSGATAKN